MSRFGLQSAAGSRAGDGGELDAGDHVPAGLLAVDHEDERTLDADQAELDGLGLGGRGGGCDADAGEVWLGDGDRVADDDALPRGQVVEVHRDGAPRAVRHAKGAKTGIGRGGMS